MRRSEWLRVSGNARILAAWMACACIAAAPAHAAERGDALEPALWGSTASDLHQRFPDLRVQPCREWARQADDERDMACEAYTLSPYQLAGRAFVLTFRLSKSTGRLVETELFDVTSWSGEPEDVVAQCRTLEQALAQRLGMKQWRDVSASGPEPRLKPYDSEWWSETGRTRFELACRPMHGLGLVVSLLVRRG